MLRKIIHAVTILCTMVAFCQTQKTDIMIVGSDHLNQVYVKDNIHTDVLSQENQADIQKFIAQIIKFKPDAIMVEELPEEQHTIDSLYSGYKNGSISIDNPLYRSEIFSIAFKMGKQLNLEKIICVNAPGGTSQSILDNGQNIELYKKEGEELRKLVTEKYEALRKGKLSFNDLLKFINQPATYNKIYHLRYFTPARVTNGTFKNPDKMVDVDFIDTKYIGAELTSVFRNRDYKIYSNIVTTQLREKPKRILVIIGAAHLGSLKSIFRDDPEYNLADTLKYLK